MDRNGQAWQGDWRVKILSRLRKLGFDTLTDFLARFPAEPYTAVAERLGDDVAAFQVEWIHYEEAKRIDRVRLAAMDSLARDLRFHLTTGWRGGIRGDFNTAGAYADWIVRLEQQQTDIKPKAKAVWDALEELHPRVGWSPSGPDDSLIVSAFARGWPD